MDAALALGVALGITITAAIWWIYFDDNEEATATALEATSDRRRELLAIYPFGVGHLIMVTGIVLVAAGIADAVHHFNHHTNTWWLGCGTAIFLLGHAAYTALVNVGPTATRLLGARVLGAAVAVPLGVATSFAGWATSTAMALILIAIAISDRSQTHPPGESIASQPGPTLAVDPAGPAA